jgi:hypothetical protein
MKIPWLRNLVGWKHVPSCGLFVVDCLLWIVCCGLFVVDCRYKSRAVIRLGRWRGGGPVV